MVMEFIFSPAKISKNPGIIFIEAVLLSGISVLFSLFVLPSDYVSVGVLAFITMGAIPVFAKLFSYSSYLFNYSESFFARHKTLFLEIAYFFLGVFFAFVLLFFILPPATRDSVFSVQLIEVKGVAGVRESITAQVSKTAIPEQSRFDKVFFLVLNNNLGVVVRAAALSFFYGAGALFLIAWNASILATVISTDIYLSMGALTLSSPVGVFKALFTAFVNFLGYLPHGLPEMLAYFIISFAGAMIARGLVKGLFTTDFRWKVIGDIAFMVAFSIFLIVVGALIEASYFL